ncbi:far upstream element-binding protein 3 isoform X3 [Plutella xylostella]|uniref:far upstream element-binding protein 3 isoform X3 n=1 Tax=Plutella xylostella TaxID=51655 RepID=UPI0018D1C846|nr:far upstream element-binding protein 3 isoform X3 [Plutella xylostella]
MSDYSSMATLQNNSQTAALAAAIQRARLVAAKIEGAGGKRPLEDGSEPSAKKLASVDTGYQQQQQQQQSSMSAAAAAAAAAQAAAARIGGGGPGGPGGPGLGQGGPPPGQGGGPPNMNMTDQLNEYIRVPDKMVGLIIGRGGEQITRLQAESGCKIQMAPDLGGQQDRVCTLTGSREAIGRARELVNQIVNHRGRENASHSQDGSPPPPMGGGGGRGQGGGGGGGLGGASQEEIMLPGPKVGLIIGKSGKTIKQLQEQSGAKMVVIQDGPNTEYEKPLRISGDPDKVAHAKQLVFELLAEKDMSMGGGGGARAYDEPYQQDQGAPGNSTEVLVPKVAVGVVIGRGGDMIKKIQAETGCRVQFHQERDDGPGDKRCYLNGKPHQVEQARQMIDDLIASVNQRREQEVRGGGRGRGGQRNGDREYPGGGAQWQDQPETRVTFTVNNLKCGLIIGRGGEVIKQINAQSGAHCELDRRAQTADRNNRTFFIKGHPDSVEHCKRIIMEKVGGPVNFINESGNGNGGGGGNGNGNGGGDFYGGGGGGGGGGPPAWGYNPHWHPANANQQQPAAQPQVQINPATGQPDYSQQWIDYYRSLGLVREAEAIEQQAKQQQQGLRAPSEEFDSGGASTPAPAPAPQHAAAASNGAQADYSAQWADYYRSIGKLKEAEAIEQQIKMKQSSQPPSTPQPAQPAPSNNPTPPMMPGGQYPYGMAYPGAAVPYAGYNPYQQYGAAAPPAGPPDHHQQ